MLPAHKQDDDPEKSTQINMVLDGRVFKATFGELMFFLLILKMREIISLYIIMYMYVVL